MGLSGDECVRARFVARPLSPPTPAQQERDRAQCLSPEPVTRGRPPVALGALPELRREIGADFLRFGAREERRHEPEGKAGWTNGGNGMRRRHGFYNVEIQGTKGKQT